MHDVCFVTVAPLTCVPVVLQHFGSTIVTFIVYAGAANILADLICFYVSFDSLDDATAA